MTTFSDQLYHLGGVPVVTQDSKLWGAAYFVDGTNGSDSNSGKSRTAAFKTIQAAINATTTGDGDIIYVRNGSYAETLTVSKANVSIIGETQNGVTVTGDTDATDTITVSAANVTLKNLTVRGYDSGADITHIAVSADGAHIINCNFSGNEEQIQINGADRCVVSHCQFITPDDTTDGACIRMEDANDCKILYCSFNIDNASEGIIHHDADNLEVGWCVAVGDDDTGASTAAFVLIEGADATSELMVHDCSATLFGAGIAENSTAVAAHGLGTADLPTTATVDTSIEVSAGFFNNDFTGCTVAFDTTGL